MQNHSLEKPVLPAPGLPVSGFRSPADASFTEHPGHLRRNSTGIPTPDRSNAEGSLPKGSRAWPFPHESPIPSHSPLLFANRGTAELEIVPSPCKQTATILSNRGEMRVVQAPPDEPPPTTHPLLPIANRNTNLLAKALTHWKQRTGTLSNRHKIHFFAEGVLGSTEIRNRVAAQG
jgi:hypothetical protein